MARSDIEAFLDSGDFVTTKEGPHFCQVGQKYWINFGGKSYLLKVTKRTVIAGKATIMFVPNNPEDYPPIESVIPDFIQDF